MVAGCLQLLQLLRSLVLCGFQLTATISLGNAFDDVEGGFCRWYFGAIVAMIVIVLAQVRARL